MADKNTETTENLNEKSKKSCRSSACWVGIFISILIVLALIAAIAFGYYRLFTANKNLTRTVVDFKKTFEQSNDAMSQAQKNTLDVQQTMQELASAVKNQEQAIEEVRKAQSSSQADLVVAQAEYLVKIANDNLQFEHNIQLALQLLNTADQAIANLPDPKLYTVREAISADVTALQSAQKIDVPGLYLQLNSLSEQLDKLPIANQFILPTSATTNTVDTADLSWWRRMWQNTWQALQHIVVIRHNQANSLPFVTPDQQVFLTQNLHAEVEQAKWALLHHQETVYRASLQQVTNWIKQYVAQNAPMTQQVLALIAQLQDVNVQPAPLNVENSLQAFQAYVKGK